MNYLEVYKSFCEDNNHDKKHFTKIDCFGNYINNSNRKYTPLPWNCYKCPHPNHYSLIRCVCNPTLSHQFTTELDHYNVVTLEKYKFTIIPKIKEILNNFIIKDISNIITEYLIVDNIDKIQNLLDYLDEFFYEHENAYKKYNQYITVCKCDKNINDRHNYEALHNINKDGILYEYIQINDAMRRMLEV